MSIPEPYKLCGLRSCTAPCNNLLLHWSIALHLQNPQNLSCSRSNDPCLRIRLAMPPEVHDAQEAGFRFRFRVTNPPSPNTPTISTTDWDVSPSRLLSLPLDLVQSTFEPVQTQTIGACNKKLTNIVLTTGNSRKASVSLSSGHDDEAAQS